MNFINSKKTTAVLLAGLFFVCIMLPVRPAQAAIEITTSTVWRLSDSPIVVNDWVAVRAGSKLTIEPGVVVKFAASDHYDRAIFVQGTLEAIGTADQPIIFTSINDDSVGGDSNGDGSETAPQAGDWWQLQAQGGSSTTLAYTIFRYGGIENAPVIFNYRGRMQITDSIIYLNGAGISNNEGDLTISNSAIYDNAIGDLYYNGVLAIQNYGRSGYEKTVMAQNNWWGTAEGPCDWNSIVGPTTTPPCFIDYNPICGSKPLIDKNIVYSPWLLAPPHPLVKKLNPVILIPGILGSWQVAGKWELDPILHTYDNLWLALKAAGYEEGKTLFALPYNWRQSNLATSRELEAKIAEVKQISGSDKVDLIGHSMGGLVARAYIEGPYYHNDVDKMIFLATPQRGATGAYLMWEGGSAGVTPFERLMGWAFEVEALHNNYFSVSQYIRNNPIASVQELLPIYNYLRDQGSADLRLYPNNYPVNQFLDSLNSADNLAKLNGVKIYNFLGDIGSTSTIANLRVVSSTNSNGDWQNGYPENYNNLYGDHGLEFSLGDQTVPRGSNSNFDGSPDIIVNSNHGHIVTDAQKAVIKDLTGIEPAREIRNNLVENFIMVRIFSPANFVITSPSGQKLGKDFSGGSDLSQIPGAYYSGSSTEQFAVIPNPENGEYKVDLLGTGNGAYKLSLSYADDATSTDKDFTGSITTGQSREFKVDYQGGSVLSDLKPQDQTPPQITILTPSSTADYFRRQKMTLDYSVTDDFSGVSSTIISLDGQTLTTTTLDLSNYPAGNHLLAIFATDKAGNSASSSVSFVIKATIATTVTDIKYYADNKSIDKTTATLLTVKLDWLKLQLTLIDVAQKLAQQALNKLLAINKPSTSQSKLIAVAQKALDKLVGDRQSAINSAVSDSIKQLDGLLAKNKIKVDIYAIIKADLLYLKNNL